MSGYSMLPTKHIYSFSFIQNKKPTVNAGRYFAVSICYSNSYIPEMVLDRLALT